VLLKVLEVVRKILRADYGIENCNLATALIAFQTNGGDELAGDKSFRYGMSTSNTLIEGLGTLVSFEDTDY
jgi:hypothetical protein